MPGTSTVQAKIVVTMALSLGHGELGASNRHGFHLGHFYGAGRCLTMGMRSFPEALRVPKAMGGATVR